MATNHGRTGAGFAVALAGACLAAAAFGDESRQPPSFEPGDISIGEPIALPFAKPVDEPRGRQPPAAAGPASVLAPEATTVRPLPVTPPSVPVATTPSGWLGMTIQESTVPGRWSVVEIAPRGPAATAGLAVGDDLTSIDGLVPRNADEVAQAITAIAAGQRVRLAISRADRVAEVEVVAIPRPTAVAGRDRATAPAVAAVAEPPAPTASVLMPSLQPAAPEPATAAGSPPSPVTSPAPAPAGTTWAKAAEPLPPTGVVPPPAMLPTSPSARGRTALGVRTVPLDADTRARFRLGDDAGAYVIGVVGDLPASRAGIPPGSVIVRLDGQPVRSPDELTRIVTAGPVDRPVPVEFVLPGGTGRRADVVLQSLEAPMERALMGEAAPQPTSVPALEGGQSTPRTSRMPIANDRAETREIRREIDRLRGLIDALERRLDRPGR